MSDLQQFESDVEQLYAERIRRMTNVEKVARSLAMFEWTRDQIARQIVQERGPTESSLLKILIAQRLYASEPQARALIERRLADYVSH